MSDGDLWRDRNKVFVAGLPAHVDDAALAEKFQPFGAMFQSKVVYDSATGKSKGFGFITFCDYANALDAVSTLDQQKWGNRVLNVRFLQPKAGDSRPAHAQQQQQQALRPPKLFGPCPPGCVSVYVGNLSYNITEQVLRKVFASCGDIKAVRFAEHMTTKEFRGFGHVQFYESAACEKAIRLDGTVVMGRPMNVDYGSRDEATERLREELQKKLKKGVCHKFQTGECTRGDDCKFAHIPAAPAATAAPVAPASDVPVCLSFQKGKCKRGDACKFQHAPETAVPTADTDTPPYSEPALADSHEPATDDVPVCLSFSQGKCKRGDKCKFRHVSSEQAASPVSVAVAPSAPVPPPPAPAADEPICLNFQKGTCKRGAACRFRHVSAPAAADNDTAADDDTALSTQDDVPICQNYLKGKCKRGAACRFQHVEAGSVPPPAAAVAVVPTVSICKNFQRGRCTRGSSCRFAHAADGEEAAEPQPAATAHSDYQKRFQSVCYNWQSARSCVRGDQCPFFHDAGVVQRTGRAEEEVEEKKKSRKRKSASSDEEEEEEVSRHEKKKKEKKSKKDKKKRKHASSSDLESD